MRFLLVLLLSLNLSGCISMPTNPRSEVDNWFSEYNEILIIDEASTSQKVKFIRLMERNYKNLTYIVNQERVAENKANVWVTIEVYDYSDIDEINDDTLKQMKEIRQKRRYSLVLRMKKDEKGKWKVEDLTQNEKLKMQGMY